MAAFTAITISAAPARGRADPSPAGPSTAEVQDRLGHGGASSSLPYDLRLMLTMIPRLVKY